MTDQLREALAFYGDPDSYTGHEQTVLAAARLVADGKVIPVEDTKEIRWCVEHERPATETTCGAFVRDLSPTPNYNLVGGVRDCNIVSARLWLGDTE